MPLAHQWRADSLTVSPVSSWPALTGTAALTQAASGSQPTLLQNAFNGHKTVRFDGIDDFLTATLPARNQPTTVSFVIAWQGVATQQQVYEATQQLIILPNGWDGWAGTDLIGGTTPAVDRYYFVTYVANGASSRLHIQPDVGPEVVVSGNSGAAGLGSTFTLGRRANGTRPGKFDLAEARIFDHALSAAEVLSLNNSYSAYFGNAVPPVDPPPDPDPDPDPDPEPEPEPPVTQPPASQPFANVRDYGAQGNGANDDTQAIRNAMAANKRVVLPQGTYRITGTLNVPSGVTLQGAGHHTATIISKQFDGDAVVLQTEAGLENLRIEGNNRAGRGVVIPDNSGRQTLWKVTVGNNVGITIHFDGLNAGSQFRASMLDLRRSGSATGNGLYNVVVASGFQNAAIPRSFHQVEFNGQPAFDFGGCNNFHVGQSTFGDCNFTENTRGLDIVNSRWMNQPSVTLRGAGVNIVACSISPLITVAAGTSNSSIVANNHNQPVVNNAGAGCLVLKHG